MNILFVAENYPPHYGGAEVMFESICEGLVKRKYGVTLVTHHIKGTPYREDRNGVTVVRVPCFGSRFLFIFLAPFWATWHARGKDLIHTTTYAGAPPAWIAGRLTGKPVLINVLETWVGQWKKYTNLPTWKTIMYEVIERPLWWLRFERYVCISHSTEQQVQGVLPQKLHDRILVNYVGFDYAFWKPAQRVAAAKKIRKDLGLGKKFVVFSYGRPGFSKGFQYLIKAFPLIRKKIPNAHLVLKLAENKQTNKERERLLALLPKKSVTVLPNIPYDQIRDYAAVANCWVTPSLCEGFGYTILEANTLGIPLVATNAGSIPEVVSGKHILVKPRSPQAIAEGVLGVKKKAYKTTRIKKFVWKDSLDRLESIYRGLL